MMCTSSSTTLDVFTCLDLISILGVDSLIPSLLNRRVSINSNDPIVVLVESWSLGIFKKVDTKIIEGSTANTKIINLSVEEQPTGEVSLGAGIGTTGGVIGGGLKEKNFMGSGVTLDTNFQISDDGVKGSVKYIKPNFNYTDNTLLTSIKSTTQDKLSSSGYKITTAGFSIGTKFEQYEIQVG